MSKEAQIPSTKKIRVAMHSVLYRLRGETDDFQFSPNEKLETGWFKDKSERDQMKKLHAWSMLKITRYPRSKSDSYVYYVKRTFDLIKYYDALLPKYLAMAGGDYIETPIAPQLDYQEGSGRLVFLGRATTLRGGLTKSIVDYMWRNRVVYDRELLERFKCDKKRTRDILSKVERERLEVPSGSLFHRTSDNDGWILDPASM